MNRCCFGNSCSFMFIRGLTSRVCHERASQTVSIRSDRAKMAGNLGGAAAFSSAKSRRKTFRSDQAEILHPRHVPLPERDWAARRTSRGIHGHRYCYAVHANTRVQRLESDGMGGIGVAGGEI